MTKRRINIKAKAKEIQDSLNQVDSSVSKLGKDANSAVSPVNNAASSIDKLSEAVSKFPKNKLSLNVDIKTSKETLGDSLQPLQELNTEIKSAEKVVNDSADAFNRLKNRVEKFKKTIDQNLDVKVNMSDSIKAAIKKQIPDTSAFETIDNFRVQIEGVANKITGLSDTWQRFSNAFENIKTFASDLSASVNSIFPKVKSGEPVPAFKGTVFSAFGDLIENINASINSEQLARFESTADSLRTFTTSLKEMISINKTFDKVKEFIANINTPATKGGTDTPLVSIIDTISTYVNSLGGLGERIQDKGEDGAQKIKTIINPRIQGITDIIGTIKNLTATFNTFNDTDSQTALDALTKAKDAINDYITTLGGSGTRSRVKVKSKDKDGNDITKYKEVLNKNVQGTRDIIKTIDSLAIELGKMAGETITNGISNVDEAQTSLYSFILKLGGLGMRGEKDVEGKNGTKTVEVLNDHVKGTRDIIKTVDLLATSLDAMAKQTIKDGTTAVDNAKTALESFITDLGNLGKRTNKKVTDEDGNITIKEVLNKNVQGTRDIIKTIDILSSELKNMADDKIQTGIYNVSEAETALRSFVLNLGTSFMRGEKDVIKEDGTTKTVEVLNDYVVGTRDVLRTIDILSADLKNLTGNQIAEGLRVIDSSREKLHEFINKLGGLAERSESNVTTTTLHEDGSITETNTVKSFINTKIQGVKDILRVVDALSGNLKDLSEQGIRTGLENLNKARQDINTFIDSLWSLGKMKEKTGQGDDNETVLVLNEKMKGVNVVLSAIRVLTGQLTSLKENTADALAALDLVKEYLPQFIKDISDFAGLHDVTTSHNGVIETKAVLSDRIQGFIAITNTLKPFASVLSELNISNDYEAKIRHLKSALEMLLTAFTPANDAEKANLTISANNINVVSGALKNLGNVLPKLSLPKEALGDTGSIKNTAQNIYDLLDAFRIMDVQAGLNNMDVISNMLAKYSGVLKNMNKIGTVDFSKIQSDFTEFVKALNVLADSNALKEMPQDNAERFGALGRALKGISSFINSIVKGGDFTGFVTNIQTAIPALTEFINRMSGLTTLSAFPDFERVARAVGSFNGRLKEATSTVEHSSRSMIRLKSIIRQIYTAFVGGAVVYSIVRTIKSAIKEMYNLEYAMARVNTIARVSSSELKNMTHFVQSMSAEYGVASSKVTKALYDINSATIKGSASLKILEQSAKLAVAGFTDIEKVTDLIAKAVNAYEYSASEAAKISDILFVTVERGINPMEELSEYMGRLFTVAANAGVSLEEVGAGLATLTARGYQTNVASTALNSAILKLSTGTKELNKLFNQYGYASSASALRTLGLSGAIEILYKATNGATEKLHDLGFNYRDIRAATTLASGAISEYNKTLALMNDETYKNGLTNEALAKVQDTVIFKFNQLKETYTVFIQSISEYLNQNKNIKDFLGALSDAISTLTKSMQGFNLSTKEQAQAGLVTLIPKLLLAYAVFKPMGKVFSALLAGVSGLTTGFKATGASLISVASSLKAAESPLTSMESEVVAVSKVTDSAKMSVDGITRGVYSFTNSIDGASKSVGTFLTSLTQMNQVSSSLSTIGKNTYAGIQSLSVSKGGIRYTLPKDIVAKQNTIGLSGVLPQLDTTSFKNLGSTAISRLGGSAIKQYNVAQIAGAMPLSMSSDEFSGMLPSNANFGKAFGGLNNYSTNYANRVRAFVSGLRNGTANAFVSMPITDELLKQEYTNLNLSKQNFINSIQKAKADYTVRPSAQNFGFNTREAFRPIIGKTDASALSINSLGNAVNTDVGKVAGQYDFKKPLVDLKNLAEETKKTVKTAQNATLTVNNLSTGYNAVDEASKNLEKTTKAVSVRFEAFNAKMKTFGATVGSALRQFGLFALQMAATKGVFDYIVGSIAELRSQEFGLKDTFSILGDNLKAGLAGAAGRFIDILSFGLTNLGEKWSLHYMNTDYVDQQAVRESRLYAGDGNKSGFGTVVASEISVLKKLNVIAEGLNEDKIIKVYNNAIDKIQQEARLRKVSKDQLETAIKVASDQRDLLLSYNDTLKKLLPNTQALNDVFNQASKNIEESVEKFASPMEKQLREMMEAQNAVSKLAKMTGLSEEQIKAGGVSVSGSNQLREILEQQQEQQQTELASLINTPLDKFLKKPEYLEKVKGATDELYASFVDVQHALGNWDSFSIKETFDSMIDDASVFAEEWEKIHNAVLKQGDNKELFGLYSHFKQSFADLEKVVKMPEYEQFKLGIDSFIKDISNAFTPEQIALISKQSDDFIKALLDMSELDRSDPKAVSKKLMDMLADPELAKQLDVLGKTYLSSIHSAEQFRKSISKLGIDLSKLGTELSPEGIIGNKFNLQSVREIKERLGGTVYGPKAIEGADFGVIDQYANIAMKGILEHNPVNVIVDSLVTEFKKNDALKDLDTNELQNRAISFIGAIQQIGSYTKDFVKQLSEMDYTKAMNRMRFGSELSTFKQYKMFGKDMISRLLGMDVTGSGGVDFGELLREFEADTKASGFDTARDNMIKRFGDAGETVWSAFADLFKDLINYEKEYISPLNTEFRNLKKRGLNFIKNYKDSMLSPIEQFNKTQALLNRQLSRISRQAKSGELKPESIKNAMDTIDKLYKLNEETMNIKVPAAITASEAVRTGSKEAFDLVARNVFKDTYKVNVRQEKLQQKLVNYSEKLWRLAEQGSKNVSESITLP